MPPTWRPMTLVRAPEAFDHPDWLFELKHDGFRVLAVVEGRRCRFVSRQGLEFALWSKRSLIFDEIYGKWPPTNGLDAARTIIV